MILVACLPLFGAWPAAAQEATPSAPAAGDAAQPDLAAMVPSPADLDPPGYVINTGHTESG